MLWTDRHTDRQTDRHTDITNIVVTLAGAREPIIPLKVNEIIILTCCVINDITHDFTTAAQIEWNTYMFVFHKP